MKNLFPFLALIVFLIMHLGIYFLLFKRMIKTRFPLLLLKYFLVLGIEPTALCTLDKHSTTELHPPASNYFFITT